MYNFYLGKILYFLLFKTWRRVDVNNILAGFTLGITYYWAVNFRIFTSVKFCREVDVYEELGLEWLNHSYPSTRPQFFSLVISLTIKPSCIHQVRFRIDKPQRCLVWKTGNFYKRIKWKLLIADESAWSRRYPRIRGSIKKLII